MQIVMEAISGLTESIQVLSYSIHELANKVEDLQPNQNAIGDITGSITKAVLNRLDQRRHR
jgi:hypothetical protein